MTLEETTQLYASVLRQLLPTGGYDTSPNTEALAVDVYAHAKLLAQADLDGKRLLKVLEELPPELLPEYETEYGLPLKCTVNVSRTFEERLQILNWVRTSRNVLNRAYLEQLLAIFGVTLIDIQKFKPLLCTAPCNSPVNTEQLRYKVFLRLQYPMNADMNCIIENYLPGYLRIEWMVDMPWSDWILNPGVTVNTNGIAHYTAYKTNQREYYDSYADFDLVTALVRSFHDADMREWLAISNAIATIDGFPVYSFTYDNDADTVTCYVSGTFQLHSVVYSTQISSPYFLSKDAACRYIFDMYAPGGTYYGIDNNRCVWAYSNGAGDSKGLKTSNHLIQETKIYTYVELAEIIISNAQSLNEVSSLHAENYIQAVANSIFNTESSKQFVKLSDLLSQFELNKTLRT